MVEYSGDVWRHLWSTPLGDLDPAIRLPEGNFLESLSQLDPGSRESHRLPRPRSVGQLQARGIKIANTTGFDTCMMTDLIRLAGEGGYEPDLWVCPDQVGKGCPAPWMAHHAARQLDVYPLRSFVKVGDTLADIEEAHAAGMWAVSVVDEISVRLARGERP
jgi:hypothetical protein